MTVDELVTLALKEATRYGVEGYSGTRGYLYVAVGVRQRALMRRAARMNLAFFGSQADGDLDSLGSADLNDIVPTPLPGPAMIERVEILDPGETDWSAGDRVSIVPLDDPTSAIPPRMTLRSGVLDSVGGDLYGAASIRVSYARLAPEYTAADAEAVVEPVLESLLRVHAVRVIAGRSVSGAARPAALAEIDAEEKLLLEDFDAQVAQYAPTSARFIEGSA